MIVADDWEHTYYLILGEGKQYSSHETYQDAQNWLRILRTKYGFNVNIYKAEVQTHIILCDEE